MSQPLRIRIFAHSWVSDWNHGNAHFLRGLARELMALGHEVRCYEEMGGWSMSHLAHESVAAAAVDGFRARYAELDVRFYQRQGLEAMLRHELAGADLVLVHEWNAPEVVQAILAEKPRAGFRALFHDTHHRAYTAPSEILRMPLGAFDGVLAFGEVIRRIYSEGFGVRRAWTFHEAADCEVFSPLEREKQQDLVWIGNWGDEERTCELMEFLLAPARALGECGKRAVVHGVRYPEKARWMLREAGIEYRGYLPNLDAPEVYACSRLSLHIPRRQYASGLNGVPTIRVFEALACGVPLVCSPWTDSEGLFRPGEDYLVTSSGEEMRATLAWLLDDEEARRQIAASGLQRVRQHHTCRHRAAQLIDIYGEITR